MKRGDTNDTAAKACAIPTNGAVADHQNALVADAAPCGGKTTPGNIAGDSAVVDRERAADAVVEAAPGPAAIADKNFALRDVPADGAVV
jgi:hypothetical protein